MNNDTHLIPYVAKAIAAGIVTGLAPLAAWLADTAGITVTYDVGKVESGVVALLTGGVVYLTRNRERPLPPPPHVAAGDDPNESEQPTG